jgi:[protein-PII] uridylyltransferase
LRCFVDSLPPEYLERHDARAIAEHARLARGRIGPVSVRSFRMPSRPELGVCVVADDALGLLARISAAFVLSGLDVVDAEAWSRVQDDRPEIVDLFWVRSAQRSAAATAADVARFQSILVVLVDGTFDRDSLISSVTRERPPRSFGGTRLRFVLDDRGMIAGIDVETLDRPGLLFTLTDALFAQRLVIVRSEIRTIGRRVFDRFFFRELDGTAVLEKRRAEIEAELVAALRAPVRRSDKDHSSIEIVGFPARSG